MHAHGILIVSPAVDFFADSPCLRQILKRTDIIWNQLEGYAFSVRTFLIFLNGRDIHGTGNDVDLIKNRKGHASRILRGRTVCAQSTPSGVERKRCSRVMDRRIQKPPQASESRIYNNFGILEEQKPCARIIFVYRARFLKNDKPSMEQAHNKSKAGRPC